MSSLTQDAVAHKQINVIVPVLSAILNSPEVNKKTAFIEDFVKLKY